MTKAEAITLACAITGLAYHSHRDYRQPFDGFCSECPATKYTREWNFQSHAGTFEWLRDAVIDKLAREGTRVDPDRLKELDRLLAAAKGGNRDE